VNLKMAEQTAAQAKLLQYLDEAYGKEKELEAALTAHIEMTTRAPYKKRLKEHLKETKGHARELERRMKKIGGGPGTIAKIAGQAQGQAKSLAKGPLHMVRGTGEAEKMLKNAKTEYWNEHEEIATYTAIETLATAVGDKETAKMARSIRREEERMASFLERQIPTLTKAVVTEEIPAKERSNGRAGSRRKSSSRSSSSRSSSNGRKASSSSRKSTSRASSSRRSGSSSSRSSSKRKTTSSRSR
jgi:ferritin-like metal-binding protein YciE